VEYSGPLELVELDSRGAERASTALSNGKSLAHRLAARLLTTPGALYSIAPLNAPKDRLYSFQDGGLIPQLPRSEWTRTDGGVLAAEVVTVDAALASAIARRVSSIGAAFVVQDWNSTPIDPHLAVDGHQPWLAGDEVYFAAQTPGLDEISTFIAIANDIWPGMLGVVTSAALPMSPSRALDPSAIDALADHATEFFVGAYDGESYLLWTPDAGVAAFYAAALKESA